MEVICVTDSVVDSDANTEITLTLSEYSEVVDEIIVCEVSSGCDSCNYFKRVVVICDEVITVVSLVVVVFVPVKESTLKLVTA